MVVIINDLRLIAYPLNAHTTMQREEGLLCSNQPRTFSFRNSFSFLVGRSFLPCSFVLVTWGLLCGFMLLCVDFKLLCNYNSITNVMMMILIKG